MARKRSNGVNVSAAIREYLKKNPEAGPTDAAKDLSNQLGKKVLPIYVSNIKSQLKAGAKKTRRGRKPKGGRVAVSGTRQNGHVDLVTIGQVREIVGRIGADTARQLIDLLA